MVLNWLMLQHKNTSIIIQISLKTWNISDSAGSSSAIPPNFRGCYFLPSRASFELWMQRASSFGTPSFSQLSVWQTSDRHGDLPRQNLTFPLHIVNKSLSSPTFRDYVRLVVGRWTPRHNSLHTCSTSMGLVHRYTHSNAYKASSSLTALTLTCPALWGANIKTYDFGKTRWK